ncbi:MAG: PIN domain-containing protein [Acidobacteriota bacterium]|jgi:predicted nucleic acid-binding protein
MLPKRSRATEKHAGGNSAFVDTSAWIALFSGRDQYHGDADRIFRQAVASKRQLFTTNLVVAETHRFFLHRAGTKAAAAALAKIEASPLVRIEFAGAAHHQSAKSWMEKLKDHPISYTDAVSFACMEAAGCLEAMTYDHHFRLAGFASSL